MEIIQEPALPEFPYKIFSLPLPELPCLYHTDLHSTLKELPSASYQEHVSQKAKAIEGKQRHFSWEKKKKNQSKDLHDITFWSA